MSIRMWVTTMAALLLLAACASTPSADSADASSPFAIDSVEPISTAPASIDSATPQPTVAEPTTDAGRKTLATQLADQLIGEVQLPAGAQPQPTAPTSRLAQPSSTSGSPNEIDSARWFTVSGTVESVLTYVQAHAPTGLVPDGGDSGGDGSAGVSFTGQATADYENPSVQIEAVLAGSTVAVRVDAQVVWLPVRTAAEFVPQTVTGAIAVRSGVTTSTVHITATQVPTVARMLDALDTQAPGERHCPSINYTTAITFDVSGTLVFTLNGCGGVTVTAAGVAQPTLAVSDALVTEVDALFGVIDAPAPAASVSASASS